MKILGSIFKTKAPVVPVIPLNGIILASSGGMRRGGLNLQMLSRLLDQAFTMRRAKAVALLINSPGGSRRAIGNDCQPYPRVIPQKRPTGYQFR